MKYQHSKKITTALLLLTMAITVIAALTLWQEKDGATAPPYGKIDISALAEKEELTDADYDILWEQTGLSKSLLQSLRHETNRKEIILAEQDRFFDAPAYTCTDLALISKAEVIADKNDYYPLYDLQPGDVLLTKSTHTLFYRHGHCAIYLGDGKILEAAAIGMPTDTTEASYWGQYPSGIHLRLKESAAIDLGSTAEVLGASAASYAEKELTGDKYHLLAGALGIGTETDATQCAYLIWAAYHGCGIDVSSRTFPVTPKSLLESDRFEILRCWGFDPKDLNW